MNNDIATTEFAAGTASRRSANTLAIAAGVGAYRGAQRLYERAVAARRDERGVVSIEYVIIAAAIAAVAIGLVAIIASKVNSTANSIPTS